MKFILSVLTTLLICSSAWAASPARPNFVVFITDDQAFHGLSCTGNTVLKTSNMDRLAATGVLFEKAFVTTSICCSSRASILTGQHMRRHGIDDFRYLTTVMEERAVQFLSEPESKKPFCLIVALMLSATHSETAMNNLQTLT